MHKILTGTIAGAAGVALLLGGAGSFALWNADASSAASSVSSGTLTLTADDDGTWTDVTNGRSAAIDPAKTLMVPGNTYRFTQTLTIGATGDDLRATLAYADNSITGDPGLLGVLTKHLDVTSSSANVVPSTTDDTYTVTPSSSLSTVTVTLTVGIPADATTGQGGTVDLSGVAFTLQQTAISS
ncbi:alternate-type signal peptide domain-containing protein [Curtobacterium sp. 9128]|uniref:alternate-type signal peptide domain-containing protein n=1 Tax=Curtobacterium sp. 9128 TaxID=1793722 RepID=UPI0011A7EEF0|nr:alternate-type signal peptide domain-containing protein [Curtobacterium sp. 9128]